MGQVHVQVTLTHYREALMARLGQLAPDQVHRYETEACVWRKTGMFVYGVRTADTG